MRVSKNANFALFLFILIGVFSRLIIHIPDVTPLTALCLLSSSIFSKRMSFIVVFLILVLSDFLLHFTLHIPVFGSWTLFAYSAWFLITASGFLLKDNFSLVRGIYFSAITAVLFWLWTNFGTWCCSMMYAHTLTGLIQCYVAALPFLRNSMIGAMAWMIVLIIPFTSGYLLHKSPRCYAPTPFFKGVTTSFNFIAKRKKPSVIESVLKISGATPP